MTTSFSGTFMIEVDHVHFFFALIVKKISRPSLYGKAIICCSAFYAESFTSHFSCFIERLTDRTPRQ